MSESLFFQDLAVMMAVVGLVSVVFTRLGWPKVIGYLLAGILMDKSQDKELVELVYNDILNRSEDVKKTVFAEIIKDKTHPCWADTAWILDVTGEKPEGK